ncbi:MAG: hypothetical protein FJY43_10480 [Betaproteobacteria bacterium]|nr:hypothetical protein [Betaproteobacteria bacterium]
MFRGVTQVLGSVALIGLGGCASITGSELQSLLVTTVEKSGTAVPGAECAFQSPKGIWSVSTPGSVMVLRSGEDMTVTCRKGAAVPGIAKLISRAHGGMFGNIIFGGGIGALIDHNKGTGYEYPNKVTVVMGESTLIDRQHEVEREQQQSNQASPSQQK